RGHVARPDVDGDRGRDGLELLEGDVEPPADRVGTRLDEHVPTLQLRARDPGQVDRDALARLRALDLHVVHLDAAGAGSQSGGLDAELVAGRNRAGAQGARDNGARARDRECTVDVEAGPGFAR